MTDKEKLDKLVAEIKRQKKEVSNRIIELGNTESCRLGLFDLKKSYEELLAFFDSMQKESVSKEFEKALAEEWQGYVDRGAATVDALEDNTQELAFAKGFYRGVQWQKEQMMAKAFPIEIDSSRSDGRCILSGNFARFDIGDKVKVIVIKDE